MRDMTHFTLDKYLADLKEFCPPTRIQQCQ